jgi:hypothetical protein
MKKSLWILSLLFLFLGAAAAYAQTELRLTASADSPAPSPTSRAIDAWVTNTEKHVVPVAEVMPENKYSFAPTGGEFKGVRTFAEQWKHLAANNYAVSAHILGEKPAPDQAAETGPESVTTKAQILDYLNGSFAALHRTAATIDAANAAETLPGAKASIVASRLALAIDAIAHSFDHYGQLVEYLRMNGIVPPGSVPRH